MAPESERATPCQWHTKYTPACLGCNPAQVTLSHGAPPAGSQLTEPTLTCSEVVERLRDECMPWGWAGLFDTTEAEKILDSWRERRVQELEAALQSCLLCLGVLELGGSVAAKEMIGRCLDKNGKVLLAKGGGSHGE
jgi:hypothetical protein